MMGNLGGEGGNFVFVRLKNFSKSNKKKKKIHIEKKRWVPELEIVDESSM